MRKKAKYFVASLLLFCFATSVKAEGCPYEDQVSLNKEASTVKAVYEEKDIDTGMTGFIESNPEEEVPIVYKGFEIKVLNLTEKLYIKVKGGPKDIDKYYYYSDTNNGTLTLEDTYADGVYTYQITVFAIKTKDKKCDGRKLRDITLVTPKFNDFSTLAICDEYPDFQYCQEYSTTLPTISTIEFYDKLEKYKSENKSQTEINQKKKEEKKEKNKKMLYIAGGCILVVGVATAAIIVIRRRSRLI